MAKPQKAFSLIELLIVIAVIAILASLTLSAVFRMGSEARMVACMNHLRQIALAIGEYQIDENSAPGRDLRASLTRYVPEEAVWVCPEDDDPQGDSYSEFSVWRDTETSHELRVFCPRHGSGSAGAALYGDNHCENRELAPATFEGEAIRGGRYVGEGTIDFADGSSAVIKPMQPGGAVRVMLLASFRKSDGQLYTVLKVCDGDEADIEVDVTPGSTFEIVTPAAIMGVRGTKFQVLVRWVETVGATFVSVTEGEVYVRAPDAQACVVSEGADDSVGADPMSSAEAEALELFADYRPPNAAGLKQTKKREFSLPVHAMGVAARRIEKVKKNK